MSTVDALSGSSSRTQSKDAFSALSSDQFVEIMFAELTNQDPLEPNDSQAILDQLSSLRSIQTDMEMMNRLDKLVGQNEFASAAGLLGAIVSGVSIDNRRVIGFVETVSQTSQGPVLHLDDGSSVLMSKVDEIAAPYYPDPDGDPDPGDDGTDPDDSTDPGGDDETGRNANGGGGA